jgi:predicted nucleic-acid-binding Zn-ribbon protein
MKQWKQRTWFQAPDGTKGSNALVAKEAGVTIGTVTNVFSYPEKVIPETKKRVLEAVKKLNYTYNLMPTMKMCNVCKVAKPFEDFYDGYKAKKQRDVTNKKYPHSRCKECDHARVKVYHKNNRAKVTKQQLISHRRREYGLTEEEYNNMVLSQNNMCAICNKPSERTLHIDHDHVTGRVRGLLCSNCNLGIGLLQEDLVVLNRAIEYLS